MGTHGIGLRCMLSLCNLSIRIHSLIPFSWLLRKIKPYLSLYSDEAIASQTSGNATNEENIGWPVAEDGET